VSDDRQTDGQTTLRRNVQLQALDKRMTSNRPTDLLLLLLGPTTTTTTTTTTRLLLQTGDESSSCLPDNARLWRASRITRQLD